MHYDFPPYDLTPRDQLYFASTGSSSESACGTLLPGTIRLDVQSWRKRTQSAERCQEKATHLQIG
jgi:hypothetical protein